MNRKVLNAERLLAAAANHARYRHKFRMAWFDDIGRTLPNYRRVHSVLLETYGTAGLRGLKITHLGAGNGYYCDFLRRKYRADVTAVETNEKYITNSRKAGIAPNFRQVPAENTGLKKASQDVLLSDFFLSANYDSQINEARIVKEAARILKRGGLFIVERASPQAWQVISPLVGRYFRVKGTETARGQIDFKFQPLLIILSKK